MCTKNQPTAGPAVDLERKKDRGDKMRSRPKAPALSREDICHPGGLARTPRPVIFLPEHSGQPSRNPGKD